MIIKVFVNTAESSEEWLGIDQDLKGLFLNPDKLDAGLYVINI